MKRFILPIPHEFDEVYSDIYPTEGGGFYCMMCGVETEKDWKLLAHGEFCIYNRPDEDFETHGQARNREGREV